MLRDTRCKKWTLLAAFIIGIFLFWQQGKNESETVYEEQDRFVHQATEMPAKLPTEPSECPPSDIGPSHADNLEKIESYQFPNTEPYMAELFKGPVVKPNAKSQPVLVTAVSSSHVKEAFLLFENINKVVRRKYPNIQLFLYDIGLAQGERQQIKKKCRCQIRRFPFEDYPPHVSHLKGYAWKPIIVQLVARERPFIFWLDTSPRFTKSDLQFLFERAQTHGILATKGYNSISSRTHTQTFEFLREDPCTYGEVVQMQACFIVLYVTDLVRNYFLKPWVACALSPGCTVPSGDPYTYLECVNGQNKDRFHLCHRFDQSVMNILMYRMFNTTYDEHVMKFDFYRVHRQGSNLV